ncbi:hypothetical protein JCM9534A_56150 [Catenuloplanes indicus JCM 9534]
MNSSHGFSAATGTEPTVASAAAIAIGPAWRYRITVDFPLLTLASSHRRHPPVGGGCAELSQVRGILTAEPS